MANIQLYYSERVLFNLLHKAITETLLQIQAHFTLMCSITISFLTHMYIRHILGALHLIKVVRVWLKNIHLMNMVYISIPTNDSNEYNLDEF